MTDSTRLFIEICILIVGLVAAGRLLHVSSESQLWQTTLALGVVSDCIVAAGAAFTVWARITLGRNWSAEVTFKQDHELIESGPYALARHPIYTGLIVVALGTAIDYGRAIGFALSHRKARATRSLAPECTGRLPTSMAHRRGRFR